MSKAERDMADAITDGVAKLIATSLEPVNAELAKVSSRLDTMDRHIENLAAHQELMAVEIGAINTRLGQMETTINRLAAKAGIAGLPASDSAGRAKTLQQAGAGSD